MMRDKPVPKNWKVFDYVEVECYLKERYENPNWHHFWELIQEMWVDGGRGGQDTIQYLDIQTDGVPSHYMWHQMATQEDKNCYKILAQEFLGEQEHEIIFFYWW